MSLPAANKRDEDDKTKRFPERQISSPSAFSTGIKAKETIEEEKEKDEKESQTNDDLRPLSDVQLADSGGVSSSERLLPSSTPIQDLPAFARRVVPSTIREDDKDVENKIRSEGQAGAESKGRRGMAEKNSVILYLFIHIGKIVFSHSKASQTVWWPARN